MTKSNPKGRWVYIGEQIEVESEGTPSEPILIRWRGQDYPIGEILKSWFDWGFPAGATQRNWKTRRHRRYYHVSCENGEIFEIYFDRKTPHGDGVWFCYQQQTRDPMS